MSTTTISLRNNQIEPVKKGVEFFKQKKSKPSLIVAPTAFGKSIIISAIAKEIDDKIIVLQPSKELLEQNYEKLKVLGGEASIYSASMGVKEIGKITYATIGSIKSIGESFKDLGFTKMIIDEADRYPRESTGMLSKFIKSSKIKYVLGLTATPLKLQTNSLGQQRYSILKMLTSVSKNGNFFKDIIHICQIQEMVENKFWTELIYEVYDFNKKQLVFNSTGSEFTDISLSVSYINQRIESKIIEKVKLLSDRKSILIFVPSVKEAINLQKKIPNSAVVYSGMRDEERTRIIEDFRNLKIRIVINVNILSIGFDHPLLDCIICGRPTASLSWWYQAVGRITRIHPDKKNGLIVDFSGNTSRFGRVEKMYFKKEKRSWKLYGENNILLTGIPLNEIGQHTEQTESVESKSDVEPLITFGKFAGKNVEDTPTWWREWMLKNFKFDSKTSKLKSEIIRVNSEKKL